ncbi:hypothetical protein [Schleiferia thermophila]|jgi:hypothetical protein|uniref:hypothetical protein n=1 Tax=Schleiferia thermophila TaxID=884107 RepID=UPI0004E7BCCE|nr:hypothetical protein [Schleiferia thermophila]KFD39792.1 hypothetical protein AT05_02965 [Schleiferia thermophila str. Yellowstone]
MRKDYEPAVYLIIFKFEGLLNKWWAFKKMGLRGWKDRLKQKLRFFKMMGTGSGNGFGIIPDFSTYTWIFTTDNATGLFESEVFREFKQKSGMIRIFQMYPHKTHGLWNGINPFSDFPPLSDPEEYPWISIVTRGSIRRSMWWKFWNYVPKVSSQISEKAILSMGMGELPLIEQATFSVWERTEDMYQWAYGNTYHVEVVKLTKSLGWYEEEMFTRFYCREVQL